MPAVRTTGKSAPTELRRTARTPAKALGAKTATQTEDELAENMDRVLRISQPQETVSRTRRAPARAAVKVANAAAGPSKINKATALNSKPADGPSRTMSKPGPSKATSTASSSRTTTVQAPATTRPARPNVFLVKKLEAKESGAPKSKTSDMAIEDDSAGSALQPVERARLAMQAINSSLKSLTTAIQSGHQYGSTPASTSTGKSPETNDDIWTDKRVLSLVETCEAALLALRSLELQGHLPGKAAEIERAAQGLVGKCMRLGMERRCLEQLATARPAILRLYTPCFYPPSPVKPPVNPSNGSNTRRDESAARIGKAPSSSGGNSTHQPPPPVGSWYYLLWLPIPKETSVMSDEAKAIAFQALMAAWIAVISLSSSEIEEDYFPLPVFDPKPDSHLHPLRLAIHIPQAQAISQAQLLCRRLSTREPKTPSEGWLYIRLLTLIAFSITVQPAPQSSTCKQVPSQIWESCHRTISHYVSTSQGGDGRAQEGSRSIGILIDWVEGMVQHRNGQRREWFSGSSWTALMDLWISLGRRLADSAAIDRALSMMVSENLQVTTPPSTVSPLTYPSTPTSQPSGSSRSSKPSARGKHMPMAAQTEVIRRGGDLAKTTLALDKYLAEASPMTSATAESSITSTDMTTLTEALVNLEDSEAARASLAKAVRAIERMRRSCVKILDRLAAENAESSLLTAVRKSLVSGVELVDDVLSDSAINLADVAQDLVAGAVDSLIALSRHPPRLGGDAAVARTTLSYLSRARDLIQVASAQVNALEVADWVRCLSAAAYNNGTKLWKENRYDEAQNSVEVGCAWGREALSLASDDQSSIWAQVREHLPKKYELLAVCRQKNGDRAGGFVSYCECLAALPPSITSRLAALSGSTSINETFGSLSEVDATLSRMASMIMNDPITMSASRVTEALTDAQMPTEVTGLIGERLFILLNEGQHRQEVAENTLNLGRAVLVVYNASQMPMRRMRMLSRVMALVSASGIDASLFADYAHEVDVLYRLEDFAEDTKLACLRSELYATAILIQSIHAYHAENEPTQTVFDFASRAMHDLRAMIIPPSPPATVDQAVEAKRKPLGQATTTRAPTRAPAKSSRTVSEPMKKAESKKSTVHASATEAPETSSLSSSAVAQTTFEDLPRISNLLGALASLLGLLGHVLLKVEALKVLRSLLRGRKDCIDGAHGMRTQLMKDFVSSSAELATEYAKLGKTSRASTVFSQTIRYVNETKWPVSVATRVELHLLHSAHLARIGHYQRSQDDLQLASSLVGDIELPKGGSLTARVLDRCAQIERLVRAHQAISVIKLSRDDASSALIHLTCGFRLCARAADAICRLAPEIKAPVDATSANAKTVDDASEDPFAAPPKKAAGQDEPAKDDVHSSQAPQTWTFTGHRLHTLQFHIAENLLNSLFDLAEAFAQRGTVKECEYFLKQAEIVAAAAKSSTMVSRAKTLLANLQYRLRRLENSEDKVQEALTGLTVEDGPDAIAIATLRGELLARRQEAEQANEIFVHASSDIGNLDTAFAEAEALLPSPKKSITRVSASGSMNLTTASRPEMLLAASLVQILRQQVWLFREAECLEESHQIEERLRSFALHGPDELYFDGRIGLDDALERFKSDLFMSSLTESTIAMPMRRRVTEGRDRQSIRHAIQAVLHRSEKAFLSALTVANNRGRIEDVRQACVSLALLRAFQTSLGEASAEVTVSAANVLASASSIAFQRELIEAIEGKLTQGPQDDLKWPELSLSSSITSAAPASPTRPPSNPLVLAHSSSTDDSIQSHWAAMKTKYSTDFLSNEHCDLSSLPSNWAVVSIHVSEDRNTMFLSRHQRGHEPLVFVTPIDRQGRRDGDEDTLTFDDVVSEFEGIIKSSDDTARNAKGITTREGKLAWWDTRRALDKQLGELLEKIEQFWLGAFKTVLNPRTTPAMTLQGFSAKLEKIFAEALAGAGRDVKKGFENPLTDALLECFATLPSKSKEEEIEDLVWFILDLYQFCGVPIAPDDLDIDQLAVDVKGALVELEAASKPITAADHPEHLFLALDKNVQGLPWESIPILRGRPVSRIPSLPFLIDQVNLGRLSASSPSPSDDRMFLNSRKVFYILNPSGDLDKTQAHFEDWLGQMVSRAGWRGIIGRPPTELELARALENHDLVLYFGHGGAEQYIRAHKVRHLPRCATTMLWGCSSGHLQEQGDLDRTGTAWSYMMAGCPSLIANLWDVTDRDIDRLSREVLQKLNLDASHLGPQSKQALLPISPFSTVEAVNASRDECKLKFLTGAAPVAYGIPMYLR